MNQTKVPLRKYFLFTQAIQELDWDNKGQVAFFEIGFNLAKNKRKIVTKKVTITYTINQCLYHLLLI